MQGLINISEAMSIALHTCVWLADSSGQAFPVRKISEALGFSQNHMAKVVQQLVRAGFLDSTRGPAGGISLAHPAAEVTILDIYRATGFSAEQKGCLLKSSICNGKRCALGQLLCSENDRLYKMFKTTTLADIVASLAKNKSSTKTGKGLQA